MNQENNKQDILYVGLALIDSIVREFNPKPVSASGYRAASGTLHAGGEAVNGAVAAAKLGCSVSILCNLGEDDAGDLVVNFLKKNGVDTGNIVRSKEHRTPVTTMLVEANGSRKSITNLAHSYNFHPERYLSCLQNKKIITLGSLFRAPFDDPEIIYAIAKAAKENDAILFADTKIPNFRPLTLSDAKKALPFVDYIFPNEDEAKYFTGETDPGRMADVFLNLGVKNVIIKLGEKGSFFKNAKECLICGPCRIDAVDATGAGDNFAAGFACELLSGRSHKEILTFANACGALCTTRAGAHAGLTDRSQVVEFIRSQGVTATFY